MSRETLPNKNEKYKVYINGETDMTQFSLDLKRFDLNEKEFVMLNLSEFLQWTSDLMWIKGWALFTKIARKTIAPLPPWLAERIIHDVEQFAKDL